MYKNILKVTHVTILATFLLTVVSCGHKGDPFYNASSSNSEKENSNDTNLGFSTKDTS